MSAAPETRYIVMSLEGSCYIWDCVSKLTVKHYYYSQSDEILAKARDKARSLNRDDGITTRTAPLVGAAGLDIKSGEVGMSRYFMRCIDSGVEVYDANTDDEVTVFGPASYQTASRVAAEMNISQLELASAALNNDADTKLKATQNTAERYRHALAQIYRYSPCPIAQRYADDALFVVERINEENDGA